MKIDKRPKLGSWAPGEYQGTCIDCGGLFIGDKRAMSCAPCAYQDENKVTISNDLEIIRNALPELDLPTDFEPAYPALKRVWERIAELESIEEGYENIKSIVKALEQEAEDREGHITSLQEEIAELEKASKQLKYLRHKYPAIIADLLTRYAPPKE